MFEVKVITQIILELKGQKHQGGLINNFNIRHNNKTSNKYQVTQPKALKKDRQIFIIFIFFLTERIVYF
jgi:hypothetical protein